MNRHQLQFIRRTALIGAGLLFIPSVAQAHLVTTGLGPVYDGIGHLVISFQDLIPVIGLSLLAGLRGPESGRRTLFVLPIAWLVGGLIGLGAHAEYETVFQWASFMLFGILVAFNAPLPSIIIALLAALLGVAHGYANGTAIREAGPMAGGLELIGILVALFVLVALVSSFVIGLSWDWTRIVVRVAGSWIAAMGLLYLGTRLAIR